MQDKNTLKVMPWLSLEHQDSLDIKNGKNAGHNNTKVHQQMISQTPKTDK